MGWRRWGDPVLVVDIVRLRETRGVLAEILDERDRQEHLKAAGRFVGTCADHELTNAEKLAVLVEEVGEVARALLSQPDRQLARDQLSNRECLRTELVHVATVAVAWIESLNGEAPT